MKRGEIAEYPYEGTITRTIEGDGRNEDETIIVYQGKMDEHMVTDEEGRSLQTSSYIISIPLVQNESGVWCVPRKGDNIELVRYGETIEFNVDNAEPSQIGGVSVYASRNSW